MTIWPSTTICTHPLINTALLMTSCEKPQVIFLKQQQQKILKYSGA